MYSMSNLNVLSLPSVSVGVLIGKAASIAIEDDDMAFFSHVQHTVRMVSNMTRSTVWIYQEHIMASLLPEAYPCVTCLCQLCVYSVCGRYGGYDNVASN